MVIRDEFGPSLAGEKCPDLLQEDTQTEGRCRQKLEVYKCPGKPGRQEERTGSQTPG